MKVRRPGPLYPRKQTSFGNGNVRFVPSPEHRSTEYFERMIGPEIEKNAAPLKAAGMSID
jgi:hypothetical protein